MKLVKFKDGSFGVRRYNLGSFKYEFLDLQSTRTEYWWTQSKRDFLNCCKSDEHTARFHFNRLTDKGTPA